MTTATTSGASTTFFAPLLQLWPLGQSLLLAH
jgi:hypothetical protein